MAAERLGLGTQVRQLKIGKSFTNSASVGRGGRAAHQPPLSKGASFHTIRYDFKPASVDPEKRGSLVVAEDGRSVNVNVPNLDPGREQTNYSGHVKESNKKDCVLIFDPETGDVTLERLSSHILLKKTRPERPERSNNGASAGTASSSGSGGQPSRPLTPLERRANSPLRPQPQHPSSRSNSPNPASFHPVAAGAAAASADGFSGVSVDEMFPGDFASEPAARAPLGGANGRPSAAAAAKAAAAAAASSGKVRGLSESSSSDDNSSSDSDDSDDSLPPKTASVPSDVKSAATASMPSDLLFPTEAAPSLVPARTASSSMASAAAAAPKKRGPAVASSVHPRQQPLSMPQVLNEDLQLTESDDSSSDNE